MQFACPFCRRKPTTKTLLRYNRRAASLGGLREAMEDRNFYYAWCLGCGFAKKAQERICCNEDRLPIVDNFRCQECTQLIVSCHANVMLQPSIKPILPAGHLVPCPNCEVMIEKVSSAHFEWPWILVLMYYCLRSTAAAILLANVPKISVLPVGRVSQHAIYTDIWLQPMEAFMTRWRWLIQFVTHFFLSI